MSIDAAMVGRVRQRALLIFVVLAGVFAMHGLTTDHDALMPGNHPPSSVTSHADNPSQPLGVDLAGVAVTAAMDMSARTGASTGLGHVPGHVAAALMTTSAVPLTVTDSVASSFIGAPVSAMTMGAACIAILSGALTLVLLALAMAHSRSNFGSVSGRKERAPRWPTDLGPPRRTSLTLVQLSLSRT